MSARAQAIAAPAVPSDAEDLASWFWRLIDAGFLAEAGFDMQLKVLFPPAGHPLLGWSQCQVTGCAVVIFTTQTFCSGCKRRFAVAGLPEEEFSAIPRPADQPRRRMVQSCRVPGCRRPWIDAPRALCSAHHWQKNRAHLSRDIPVMGIQTANLIPHNFLRYPDDDRQILLRMAAPGLRDRAGTPVRVAGHDPAARGL